MLMHWVFWPAKLKLWPAKLAYHMTAVHPGFCFGMLLNRLTVSPVAAVLAAMQSGQLWPCFTSAHHSIPCVPWWAAVLQLSHLSFDCVAQWQPRICREGQGQRGAADKRKSGWRWLFSAVYVTANAVYMLASSLQLQPTVQLFGLFEAWFKACVMNSVVACCKSRACYTVWAFPSCYDHVLLCSIMFHLCFAWHKPVLPAFCQPWQQCESSRWNCGLN